MKSQNKSSKQKQIDEIKVLLKNGKERQEIWQTLSKNVKTTERTFDRRLKEARKQLEPIEKEATAKLNNILHEAITKRAENAKQVLKQISEIDKQIIEEFSKAVELQKQENPDGLPVLSVFNKYKMSRLDLNEVFARNKLEAGEPTVIAKNENNNQDVTPPKLNKLSNKELEELKKLQSKME